MTPPPAGTPVPTAGDAVPAEPPRAAEPPGAAAGPSRATGGLLVLAGMLLVALNLRAAMTSLGALLDEVRVGLALSGAMAGFVTTLPAIAFAGLGATTPWLVRRFSPARLLVLAMLALTVGQVLRAVTGSAAMFLLTSALALAGIAVANILLPMLVKQHFPHRTGLVTGAYVMTMTLGATVAAASAVPVAHAFGSWRAGLGVWAGLAAVAVLPWLPAALRSRSTARRATRGDARSRPGIRPGRTRLGWAMAVYFGAQSLSGYAIMGWLAQLFRDAGFRPQDAGLLLAGVTALGVPIALLMPALAGRLGTLRPLIFALTAASSLAYLGLAFAPRDGAVLWVVLLAFGQGAFPLILTTIGLRARTADGTVALSAFAQSTGYLIAALGPLLVGIFYGATGGWTAPIGFLLVALMVQTSAGVLIARPRYIEDER
ncbi:MFS transporter, CP family, cyanate transporter [Micromonospora phaseoli]|uniref:MFS transporter, CP family, cyanate transporter n=1 Tax=Micromonospora phaseoli TaxID=1144548 RepID=A0A1H7ASP2_9ACTN|nr:MFS transporter [Micromonospora phaseoli]PZV96194.1 CP family cyanate transporter-like MFS transporter [Micromonospora phaseoli]GIJ79470.1 MFS transporter [Micromonospora phaseoli]SEJ68661.1 MFS transporter, CP family, cyanate transporter [Micromonospora phaseoli]